MLKTYSAAWEFLLYSPKYSVAADFDKKSVLLVAPMLVADRFQAAVDSIDSGSLMFADRLSVMASVAEQAG